MTLYEYNGLTETEKFNTLWEEGAAISDRRKKDFRIILYQLYSFYVEVYYQTEENKIYGLKSFSSTKLLEPYLKQIKVHGLQT